MFFIFFEGIFLFIFDIFNFMEYVSVFMGVGGKLLVNVRRMIFDFCENLFFFWFLIV